MPTFHSRRMNQLLLQSNRQTFSKYVELEGSGHWFDGVLTTTPLAEFYIEMLSSNTKTPIIPQAFSIVVANPSEMGSRGGIKVDQLCTPGQGGKINVERKDDRKNWILQTSNILRFHFHPHNLIISPEKLIGDSNLINLPQRATLWKTWFVRGEDDCWRVSHLKRH